jgi:histidinol-phosphatase (PHP family)
MAQKAIEIGLEGICFTDHADLDRENPKLNFEFSYNDYMNELLSVRASFSDDLEIFTGIELGMQPHNLSDNKALLRDKRFDFIIGSIHCVNKKDMYEGDFLDGISINEGIMYYFKDMLHCIDNFDDFDVLGHLDAIRRYIGNDETRFSYDLYKGFIHNVLYRLVNSYKGIEVNTSGLRYGLSSYHPLPQILKLYRFLGGEIITLGSDSHSPDTLGYEHKNALKLLSTLGFRYYTIFKGRKPVFIKI